MFCQENDAPSYWKCRAANVEIASRFLDRKFVEGACLLEEGMVGLRLMVSSNLSTLRSEEPIARGLDIVLNSPSLEEQQQWLNLPFKTNISVCNND